MQFLSEKEGEEVEEIVKGKESQGQGEGREEKGTRGRAGYAYGGKYVQLALPGGTKRFKRGGPNSRGRR